MLPPGSSVCQNEMPGFLSCPHSLAKDGVLTLEGQSQQISIRFRWAKSTGTLCVWWPFPFHPHLAATWQGLADAAWPQTTAWRAMPTAPSYKKWAAFTLHQNLSHSLPRKCFTYLRHCRSSNTIHVPVDRDTVSSCSRSPSQDLSWVHPYSFFLWQRKSWKPTQPGLSPLSLRLPQMWLPSSCWVFLQPSLSLTSFTEPNPNHHLQALSWPIPSPSPSPERHQCPWLSCSWLGGRMDSGC